MPDDYLERSLPRDSKVAVGAASRRDDRISIKFNTECAEITETEKTRMQKEETAGDRSAKGMEKLIEALDSGL